MKELSPEVQASIIRWAGQAAIVSADKKANKKGKGKGKKNFNDLFAEEFETNYKKMHEIIDRAEGETEEQQT